MHETQRPDCLSLRYVYIEGLPVARGEKAGLMAHLHCLAAELKRRDLLHGNPQIIKAKVPIVKCRLRVGPDQPVVPADISLGATNGAIAVQYILRQARAQLHRTAVRVHLLADLQLPSDGWGACNLVILSKYTLPV